jgi:nucleoid-associated protein YgaU
MSRVTIIVGLVGCMMANAVAFAGPVDQVRVPVTVLPSEPTEMTPESARETDSSVVVERGDHLWKISARHLNGVAPQNPIAPYWREVVTINTPRLRSGDPDLIYPGEIVDLPAIP